MRLTTLLLCSLMASTAHAASDSRATEVKLAKSLIAIKNNRLDIAMNEVDSLLRVNPNYKLAQLVKGDLLMAKAGAITSMGGGAPRASGDKIQDLRDEARVRIQRTQAQPQTLHAPQYLWQLNAQQKFALVVDTSRSTLYVYENVKGEPRYVTDFYVTIGKLGTEKVSTGDQRTPLGVYFIQANLPKNQLADMYGSGAFPLSYPNEWDKRNNRTGSGIWLHGTSSDTYSRPPRASNGCVVLNNDDLNKLAPYLQVGITPVIITNKMAWSTTQDTTEKSALLHEIEQWRQDWASMNTSAYLKHYARNFNSDGVSYDAWAKQKQSVNNGKSWIKVNLGEVSLLTYPQQPGMVVVNFEQDYSSSNLSNRMKKRQYWIKQNNRWQIIYEGSA
ncbi:L,D-transpeptidase family protein [Gallionella capsiferriformans]|jgi:murein L,D-transpeptidase YafK|uniref:ErfK/YbiS/YcfS/YnhG family protein n=1 Tax=Gallionella capsiferriformans (strain ES-2) TaxID=395494 RepID=D9SJE5_GALCS|nr:L,D-transpeptidase [Gallionella capsiferriformans]ADL56333.1 ErfK/YbiS/YcfS/YnhG family protein [Gallionella capsiferriformans ES-2]